MNKKLKQSSSNSETSGTGRYSIFESAVTPFFASVRDDMFDTQRNYGNLKQNNEEEPKNTQQCIERLVRQNQNSGFHQNANMNGGFELGFSFAGGFDEGEDSHFSFDHNSFDHEFTFLSSFHEQQSPNFFQSNICEDGNNFSRSIAESIEIISNPQQKESQQQSFTQTLNNDKKSTFFEMFSFQNNDEEPQFTINKSNNPQKKRSLVEQYRQQKKQSIIYEVESKFQCEGQTNFMQNHSQSRSLSQNNKSMEQRGLQDCLQNESNEYETLRQSIIKEISQMDSDQWEERNDDFIEDKREINVMSNQKLSASRASNMNESRSEEKRNNFKQSIINRLLVDSDMENNQEINNDKQFHNNPLRTSRSMIPFRVRNEEQKQSKQQKKVENIFYGQKNNSLPFSINESFNNKKGSCHKKQRNTQNIYESQVEQVTNQRIQIFKNSAQNFKVKNQRKSQKKQQDAQKTTDNNVIQKNKSIFGRRDQKKQKKKEVLTQVHIKNTPKPQQNQIKRKRPVFQFKTRNRINYKNQVIDQRQQFEHQQKQKLSRNEFISENLQFHSDMQTKPIQLYQSAARENEYGKGNSRRGQKRSSNDLRQTSKKSFNQMNVKESEEIIRKKQILSLIESDNQCRKMEINKVQNKDQQLKQRKFNILNLKRRNLPDTSVNNAIATDKKEIDNIINFDPQLTPQQKLNYTIDINQKTNNPRNRFELNFNRKNKLLNNNQQLQVLDKLQKASQRSSKQSFSSDGIKIDTKGFMDKVLNNAQGDRNQNNGIKANNGDRDKPIINFKRLNRFSSMFNKDTLGKQKLLLQHQQQQKQQKSKQKDINQQIHQDNNLTKTPKQQITQNPYKGEKSPNINNQQRSLTNNNNHLQFKSPMNNNNNNTSNEISLYYEQQQKKEITSQQKQLSYKSQQSPQQSLNSQRHTPSSSLFHLPKYTFSKRTPPKQQLKSNSQSKSKSVTFDTVKRIDNNDNNNGDIYDDIGDNFSFDSGVPVQKSPANSFNTRETFVKKRENNFINANNIGNNSSFNNNNKQFSSQNHNRLLQQQPQRRIQPSPTSTFSSISSRSRKSAQMMKEILDVIEQAQNVYQMLRQKKRQADQQYRRVSFLNKLAKQRFSDEKIKKMSNWEELQAQFQGWEIERQKQKRRNENKKTNNND